MHLAEAGRPLHRCPSFRELFGASSTGDTRNMTSYKMTTPIPDGTVALRATGSARTPLPGPSERKNKPRQTLSWLFMTGFSAHLMFSRGRPSSMQQCCQSYLVKAVWSG